MSNCRRCGLPEKPACLVERNPDPEPLVKLNNGIIQSCINRCYIDMSFYREATLEELKQWRKDYPCVNEVPA